ncbi:DNA-binding XRE family transcriptional regulator [Scopulibacillus darangshiensis]|uniref:DNA-binding XRE family transcriptional regulator n=1 Tax=Scopulibacillus darangshiensis TaxID=442528 RepID=A0A4R2PAT7_9BACL|nr:helix-turn-helix transcriptional regulator [Scopulibacillus darangshiensis]TCP32203.1 DNA-binding XRE family transcriptional regulator [Scopulibacillus darangshiensis]
MKLKCRLRIILAEKNIPQGEFADKVGIAQTTISLLARDRTLPGLMNAYKIARGLDMPIEKIWVIDDD